MPRADRPPQRQRRRIDLFGDRPKGGRIGFVGQIEKRPGVHVARRQVDQKSRRGCVPLQDILKLREELDQVIRWHADIFDAHHGGRPAAQVRQARQRGIDQVPEPLGVIRRQPRQDEMRRPVVAGQFIDELLGDAPHDRLRLGFELDQHRGARLGRHEFAKRLGPGADQRDQAMVEQYARRRTMRDEPGARPERGIEIGKTEEQHATAARSRLRLHGQFRQQRQGSFRTRQ